MSAPVIESLTNSLGRRDVRVIAVPNEYFGGNIGVTGLMVGEDLARVLAREPEGHPLPVARRVPQPRSVPRRHGACGSAQAR